MTLVIAGLTYLSRCKQEEQGGWKPKVSVQKNSTSGQVVQGERMCARQILTARWVAVCYIVINIRDSEARVECREIFEIDYSDEDRDREDKGKGDTHGDKNMGVLCWS